MKITAESDEIVGATIFYADNWFAALAAAFARRDLDHPDVRFFFEQKIKSSPSAGQQNNNPPYPTPLRRAPCSQKRSADEESRCAVIEFFLAIWTPGGTGAYALEYAEAM